MKKRLKPEEVLRILNLYRTGVPINTICTKYEISHSALYHIINGESWTKVTGLSKNKLRSAFEQEKRKRNKRTRDEIRQRGIEKMQYTKEVARIKEFHENKRYQQQKKLNDFSDIV